MLHHIRLFASPVGKLRGEQGLEDLIADIQQDYDVKDVSPWRLHPRLSVRAEIVSERGLNDTSVFDKIRTMISR